MEGGRFSGPAYLYVWAAQIPRRDEQKNIDLRVLAELDRAIEAGIDRVGGDDHVDIVAQQKVGIGQRRCEFGVGAGGLEIADLVVEIARDAEQDAFQIAIGAARLQIEMAFEIAGRQGLEALQIGGERLRLTQRQIGMLIEGLGLAAQGVRVLDQTGIEGLLRQGAMRRRRSGRSQGWSGGRHNGAKGQGQQKRAIHGMSSYR